ncbi:phage tail tube protein [Aurantimonas sp. 22II-16-19i]|uniref:phage tail tube protein n=1 Tax=Aurantimonas sp. 22II-16-19i TaxID=1317114 RepID=UPI0009F7DA18|nr:phage tail tube protein [Aurantimonas sp. 22II-16-19i]ORE90146.1 hypothetical protein ATO4_22027 [Aurantimonas sp. 22II-16-19i]
MAKVGKGTKLFVGPAATVQNPALAAYTAVTGTSWKQVAKLKEFGEIGEGSREVVKDELLDEDNVSKFKGVNDPGSTTVKVQREPADAGQLAMKAAVQTDAPLLFKLVYSDGATQYFAALVVSAKNEASGANDVMMTSFELEYTGTVAEQAAA